MTAWGVESGHIEVTVRAGVAVITLRREEKLNALTAIMRRELAAILRHYGHGGARGIVLTGTGRAFSAGEDLTEAAVAEHGLVGEVELFQDITRAALETRVPVVAALNGIAVGGACEITLCFDARIGSTNAEYFLPENNIGLSISNASSLLLPRLVGNKALGLVLGAARISADEALALGLLDEVVAPEDLLDAAIRLVHRWTQPGSATATHLELLRPPMTAIEAAMARETEAARQVDHAGIAQAGIERFLTRAR
jgi:enoyl-CoA hydratase/carnithine racemase